MSLPVFYDIEPLGKVSAIEMHPCKDYGDHVEQCKAKEADFFSVFLHYEPDYQKNIGGLDCVADFEHAWQARRYARKLRTKYLGEQNSEN